MPRKNSSPAIHPKWLVLIVLLLIGYGLLQPVLNSRWGWKLPSLTSLLSDQAQIEEPAPEFDREPNATSDAANETQQASERELQSDSPKQPDNLLYGLLRETRPDEYISPAGLRYTRGSEEGHRLDHLARHLKDQPDRPGRHGVFQADMPQVLIWLDEAYGRANQRAKGTKTRKEDGRTVVEVSFAKPIGYIGGRDGGRQGHPESKRLRMVLDGDRVITAFPF